MFLLLLKTFETNTQNFESLYCFKVEERLNLFFVILDIKVLQFFSESNTQLSNEAGFKRSIKTRTDKTDK